ncbi:SMI1/KNR4 family protein [Flavobacterium sp. RHBU_3]|uniref:SMI1/KNR4 family protein n=1 Tax=Flavobacterium sp. RHBU_3 TaxID=3391184 RepID=UPI003984F534
MQYEKLIALVNQNPDIVEFAEFGVGVSEEWIAAAEARLQLKLPPSYVWWLKNFCGGEVYGEEVLSIYEVDFDEVVGGDIVYVNEMNREEGYSDESALIIYISDIDGTYFFKLTEADASGEFPVYLNTPTNKYANNFIDFLIEKITE